MSLLEYFQNASAALSEAGNSSAQLDAAEVPRSESVTVNESVGDSALQDISESSSDLESDQGAADDTDINESDAPPPKKRALIRAPETECGDVANYLGKSLQLPDAVKYQLLVNHFRPGATYKFPRSTNGRSFQYSWLQQYPWLSYSKQENGGICLPCVLFASSGYHGSDPGILVRRPLISFTKALESFRKHAAKEYHKFAVVQADNFRKVMENWQPDIQQRINQATADRVSSNSQKLASILKVIVLCGRQNIALCGHHDNITDLEKDTLMSENHGNFWALLNFSVDAGDTVIGEHLATAARNATYTSSVIQNQIVDILADQIRHTILDKVKRAIWYTIISDEVTDVSNKEQLSLVLRYVDPNTVHVREDLVSFFECDEGVTGRCLANKIIRSLQTYGLDLGKLRGQSYDGAGNMAGSNRGTAALISAQYPLALYLHCASHALNVAVEIFTSYQCSQHDRGHRQSVCFFLLLIPKGNECWRVLYLIINLNQLFLN